MDTLCTIAELCVCESPYSNVDGYRDVRGHEIEHTFTFVFLLTFAVVVFN